MITSFKSLGQSGGGGGYVLPTATETRLGGIKVGQNLTIDSGGTLSADAQAVSVATTATTGVVQVGSGLSITSGGVLSTDIDLSDYAEKSELSGYVQTSAMSGYVETNTLSGYQTTEAMSAYQTTQGMSGYVQTSAMSGYVPTTQLATTAQTGVVKIGEGINVDSAGTISVTGSTGGGIEVVTELPSSGTDGQTVLLETIIPEKHIHLAGMGTDDNRTQSVTAIGITAKTFLFDYNNNGTLDSVYVNPDGSYSIYDPTLEQENIYPVGETTAYTFSGGNQTISVTGVVTTTGCTFTISQFTWRQNAIDDVDQRSEEKQVLYTWSDAPLLTADIDYTTSSENPWCVRFKYSEIPNNTTLVVWKYKYSEDYRHLVYENGALHSYTSSSADTYTATTYVDIAQYGFVDGGRYGVVYWTDDEIIVYSTGYSVRVSINTDALYKNGWHKEIEHKESNKAFYKDYVFYDGDFQIIIKNNAYEMYDVGFKLNPSSQNNTPLYVYSKNNSAIGPFFAPTTTGSTGQVCIAGNGWAAPTWTNPENITNGVKFWKGTLDEYEAIGAGNYDANTLYICTDE